MRSRPRGPRPGRSVRLPPLDALGGNVHESTYHQRGRPGRSCSRGHRVIGVRWDVSAVREQHHGVASDRRTGSQLAADRERSECRLPEGPPRGLGERAVPDLGQPSAEARRDVGRRERPDVIEMGNTEMTKYMAAGAFQDLTSLKGGFANSSTWLQGLAAAGVYNGKLLGVPYYAGSRVVTYRTDLFKKANIKVPKSLAQYTLAAKKLGTMDKDKSFSPVYVAGTDWYV